MEEATTCQYKNNWIQICTILVSFLFNLFYLIYSTHRCMHIYVFIKNVWKGKVDLSRLLVNNSHGCGSVLHNVKHVVWKWCVKHKASHYRSKCALGQYTALLSRQRAAYPIITFKSLIMIKKKIKCLKLLEESIKSCLLLCVACYRKGVLELSMHPLSLSLSLSLYLSLSLSP